MTASNDVISRAVLGNKRMVVGTFTDDDASGNAGAGQTINTGLTTVEFFSAIRNRSSVDSSGNGHLTVYETFPTTDGDIILLYDASGNGVWQAYGR